MIRMMTVVLVALSLLSCAAEAPFVWASNLPPSRGPAEPPIRPGDRIFLLVQGQDAMSGELPVRPDGSVVQATIGKVDVAGLTANDAARTFSARLKGMLVNPQITVSIVSTSPAKISVVGEVVHPGYFEIEPAEGVLNALARAGGLTDFADRDSIFVLRKHPSLERIRFRYSDLTGGQAASIAFRLQSDDIVVVE